jgi:polyhydroxybutyrate depolymerase
MRSTRFLTVLLALCMATVLRAAPNDALEHREWKIDGVTREALVHLPSDTSKPMPLVFVFHGHGGNSKRAAQMFRIGQLWPEAIVVYPQGIPTPGRLTDPQGEKNGWQKEIGDQDDRDLHFFDAMLESIRKEQKVDESRIFVTGHSNGGSFTYLLLAARGDVFAAIAPSGALEAHDVKQMKPKPVFHVAGSKDPLVKFEWQKEMINAMIRKNGCDPEGKKDGELITRYESKTGNPVVTYIYNGGHGFPPEAPAQIVKFFKIQQKPTTQPTKTSGT